MKIKALANVIGTKAAVQLVGLFFGMEGQIELAQGLDSERLRAAVEGEASMEVGLKKAGALMAVLVTSRERLMNRAKNMAKKNPADPNLTSVANEISGMDREIALLQKSLDKMTMGRKQATQIVDRIQTQVQTNLVKDQITLTQAEFNEILEQQVAFSADMITALPGDDFGGALRKDVQKDVADKNMKLEATMDIYSRMIENQGDALNDETELDEAGQTVMNEILGK